LGRNGIGKNAKLSHDFFCSFFGFSFVAVPTQFPLHFGNGKE
jgi:hypothetical protein